MSIFWSIVKGLNDVLVNTLTGFENNEETSNTNCREEMRTEWIRLLDYCSDEVLDKYCKWYPLYCSVEENGRYTCIRKIADYCSDRDIKYHII